MSINFFRLLCADLEKFHNDKFSEKNTERSTKWLGILSPRFLPILLYRISAFLHAAHLGVLGKLFTIANLFLFGIEIPARCKIGGGISFPHTVGTVIGAYQISENVTIFQGVTLGALELDYSFSENLRPTIGSGVIIGAGAKVLGGIHVGDHSVIGANAVVLTNIPAYSLAVGIPAIIKSRRIDDSR